MSRFYRTGYNALLLIVELVVVLVVKLLLPSLDLTFELICPGEDKRSGWAYRYSVVKVLTFKNVFLASSSHKRT